MTLPITNVQMLLTAITALDGTDKTLRVFNAATGMEYEVIELYADDDDPSGICMDVQRKET